MQAVILAAGWGSRLGTEVPKILLSLNGKTILDHHIKCMAALGIEEIVIVTGYKKELIEEHIQKNGLDKLVKIRFAENKEYRTLQNGYSVFCAKEHITGPFLLAMGDHLLDYTSLKSLVNSEPNGFVAVNDTKPLYTSIEQATKVKIEEGKVTASSKKLVEFNGLDTGFFIVPKEAFDILERNYGEGRTEWNDCVIEYIRKGLMKSYDIRSTFWQGINTPAELESAIKQTKNLDCW